MLASQLPSLLHTLPAVAGRFGAGRLFALIIIVFLAIMAALIVPLEVRLRRQRAAAARRGESTGPRSRPSGD